MNEATIARRRTELLNRLSGKNELAPNSYEQQKIKEKNDKIDETKMGRY